MSTYVVGDVQGCFDELQLLLQQCGFDPERDRVWLVGDLVNRGPKSLEVLRWAMNLGDACVCVLGNHDLHLLAVAYAGARLNKADTLNAILDAPDRETLLDWLRTRPLFHREGRWAMVHAGLWPQWTLQQAQALADEVAAVLRSTDFKQFFLDMYGNRPDTWSDQLGGIERMRFVVNVMTRMRLITSERRLEYKYKAKLEDAPAGTSAWFDVPPAEPRDAAILFGHWSALGLRVGNDVIALDTGCVWGDTLTAYRLEDGALFQQASMQPKQFE